jgi:hypothetical protein
MAELTITLKVHISEERLRDALEAKDSTIEVELEDRDLGLTPRELNQLRESPSGLESPD